MALKCIDVNESTVQSEMPSNLKWGAMPVNLSYGTKQKMNKKTKQMNINYNKFYNKKTEKT